MPFPGRMMQRMHLLWRCAMQGVLLHGFPRLPAQKKPSRRSSMFYYLDGVVAELQPYLAVIDCGGVGYACKTTNHTLAALKKGQRGKLYTYLNVGEDVFDLYGFATASELTSFRLLIGVSG